MVAPAAQKQTDMTLSLSPELLQQTALIATKGTGDPPVPAWSGWAQKKRLHSPTVLPQETSSSRTGLFIKWVSGKAFIFHRIPERSFPQQALSHGSLWEALQVPGFRAAIWQCYPGLEGRWGCGVHLRSLYHCTVVTESENTSLEKMQVSIC